MSGSPSADVVVLGAGAAGLAAARILHDAGLAVVVLEARERLGGRIWTHHDARIPVPIELGAEFIHGRAPRLNALLERARLGSVDIEGTRWMRAGRRLRRIDDFWDRVSRIIGRIDADTARDGTFQAFIEKKPGGLRLASDRRLASQFVENFHAADPRIISARAVGEGSPGDDVRERRLGRVAEGYGRVIEWLAAPLEDRIRTAAIVSRVRWRPRSVRVFVRSADGRERFGVDARAAIVAVPAGVLAAAPGDPGAIGFEPEIDSKRRALAQIAVGSVVRVVLQLGQCLWTSERIARRMQASDLDRLAFLHSTDEDFPVWWTSYPARLPIIVAWRGGPGARRLAQLARAELEARAAASLARHFGMSSRQARSTVEAAWVHDWDHDPFARGAYSYARVNGIDAPRQLARPLRSTLFFAGEATDVGGATGTVDGALASGERAARQVLRVL